MRQAEETRRQLAAFHEITTSIVSSLDLDQSLAAISRAMTIVLRADVGAIYLLDEEAHLLRLRGIYGQRSAGWMNHTLPLDQGMNAQAVRTGAVQRTDDYWSLAPENRARIPMVEAEPMRSVITAPLINRGRRLGSMGAIRRAVSPFDDHEVFLLEMLADHASIAVDNALAYAELGAARQREMNQLREHAQRMAALEEVKSQFLRLASHELRAPLAVLRGYLSMLEDGSLGEIPAGPRRVLPILSAKFREMNMLVDQMLETARLEDGRIMLIRSDLDLREVVGNAVHSLEPLTDGKRRVLLDVGSKPIPIQADRSRIQLIVTNLLDNAIKYSPEDSDVVCTVSGVDGTAVVAIRDHGLGIAREHMPTLFTRFGRIVTADNSHIPGTGLGLYLARELARMHGGDIKLESEVGAGSTFTLCLPLIKSSTGDSATSNMD